MKIKTVNLKTVYLLYCVVDSKYSQELGLYSNLESLNKDINKYKKCFPENSIKFNYSEFCIDNKKFYRFLKAKDGVV